MNLLEKSGAWFAWKGERIGQGRENAKEFLKANPDVAAAIEQAVLQKCGIQRAGEAIPVVEAAATEATANGTPSKKKDKPEARA
jgi:recombination protein RecA